MADTILALLPILCLFLILLVIYLCPRKGRYLPNQLHIYNSPLLREDLNDTIIEGEKWQCLVCAHANHPNITRCHLCGTPKETFGTLLNASQMSSCMESSSSGFGKVLVPKFSSSSLLDLSVLEGSKSTQDDLDSNSVLSISERQRALRYRRLKAHRNKNLTQRQRGAHRRKLWQRMAMHNGTFIWVRRPQDKDNGKKFKVPAQVESQLSDSFAEQVRRNNGLSMGFFTERGTDGKLQWRQTDSVTIPIDDEEEKLLNDLNMDIEGLTSLQFQSKMRWFLKQVSKKSIPSYESILLLVIRRDHVLLDSIAQLNNHRMQHRLREHLRIEFSLEPAIDIGGVLREWFSIVCKELFRPELGLFITTHAENMSYWINPASGIHHPKHLTYFRFAGRLFGKAIMESLVFEARFALPLLKHFLGVPISFSDLEFLDQEMHKNCLWLRDNSNVESLCLTFSVLSPDTNRTIDLKPNGRNIDVTDANKHEYLMLLLRHKMLDSVSLQLGELLAGLHEIIPRSYLAVFDYQELDFFLCGIPVIDVNDWEQNTLVRYSAGNKALYEKERTIVQYFWDILRRFSDEERARLLQFATGSSRVPVEGFRALMSANGCIHPFTIQLVPRTEEGYGMFPRAHTCYNSILLPLYDSLQTLENYLTLVIQMEITGFGLE